MIVRGLSTLAELGNIVNCPKGGFISNRYLLESDKMGFSLTMTIIPVNGKQRWHYKNHLEACLCISGTGILVDVKNNKEYTISKGDMYALNNNDEHTFEALEEVVLVCVFNPSLVGNEVHQKDGSYKLGENNE